MKEGTLFGWVVALVVLLLIAALTHLSAILLLPRVATKDAYTLLSANRPVGRMTLLPPSRPGDTLVPFRDPATVQGVCFFDLGKSPFRVKAKAEEGQLLTLSFRTPEGKIFYSMTDRAALHDKIDIRLVTGEQLEKVEDNDDEDQGLPEELRLRAPSLKGLVVATVLVSRPSEAQDAEARVKGITCAPELLSPAS